MFRTAFIDPTPNYNILKIKQKWLLFNEQPFKVLGLSPVSTPGRTEIEPVYRAINHNRFNTNVMQYKYCYFMHERFKTKYHLFSKYENEFAMLTLMVMKAVFQNMIERIILPSLQGV